MAGQSRRGILTHPALMASLSRSDESFPIGMALRPAQRRVQGGSCAASEFRPPSAAAVSRGRLDQEAPRGAHHPDLPRIVPQHDQSLRFIFESFDEVGRYRMTDHGAPVDTSVTLNIGMDVDGTYASGDELIAKFGESQAVRACFAEKYIDFAVAHAVTDPADTCSIEAIGKSFAATGDLKQLVVSVAGSDSFRLRLAEGSWPMKLSARQKLTRRDLVRVIGAGALALPGSEDCSSAPSARNPLGRSRSTSSFATHPTV